MGAPNLIGLLLTLAIGLAIAWALVVWHTARRLTRPPRKRDGWALARNVPTSPDAYVRDDGSPMRAASWSFSADGAEYPVWDLEGDAPDGPSVVFTPGWGESRWSALERAAALLPRCARVVLWDPPGHGDGPGVCALGAHEARPLRELIETVGGERGAVLYGYSLGAGVSLDAARENPSVLGVIAEAPYRLPVTPARGVMRSAGLPYRATLRPALVLAGLMTGSGTRLASAREGGWFDRAELARQVSCPVVVIHGDADSICPVEDGRTIASAAPSGELLVLPGAGHTDLTRHESWPAAIERALAMVSARAPATADR